MKKRGEINISLRFGGMGLSNKLLVKISIGFVMITISFCFYYIENIHTSSNSDIIIEEENPMEVENSEESYSIKVDISGAVKNPGVIELTNGSRVFEAINKAGGLTEKANISVINLAEILVDGEKKFIPEQEDSCCIVGNISVKDISEKDTFIYVSVIGEIKTPSVIKINSDCRVIDAIDAAGGAITESDLNHVNLAEKLVDEMIIYIPKIGEKSSQNDLININTASAWELNQLSGIGEVLAQEIVKYREQNGYFKKTEDLMKVSGIGQGKFNDIKNQICVY